MSWKDKAKQHFLDCQPVEGCGLLAKKDNKEIFWPCKNLAKDFNEETTFAIDPFDYAACEDSGAEILAVIHSHVEGSSEPSEADVENCAIYMLDWYIYSIKDNNWHYMEAK